MREILFRGKDTRTGEWRYSMTISRQSYDDDEIFSYYIGHNGNAVTGKTLGQYTGLRDKNGVKIFEGDVVRDIRTYMAHLKYVEMGLETLEQAEKYKDSGELAVVEFCTEGVGSCGCCYEKFDGSGFKAEKVDMQECIIIGNIHDNPELLK